MSTRCLSMRCAVARAPHGVSSSRVRRGLAWRLTTGLAGLAGALVLGAQPAAAQPANEAPRWHVFYEAQATAATRWLSGARVPSVSTPVGGGAAVGLQRAVGPEGRAGLMLRGQLQPVHLREAGDSWRGGTVREVDVLAHVDRVAAAAGRRQLLLSLTGGAAVLTGAADILPFNELGVLQPMAEVGLLVRPTPAHDAPAVRHVEYLARFGVMRLNSTVPRPLMSSGWSNRITLGARITR